MADLDRLRQLLASTDRAVRGTVRSVTATTLRVATRNGLREVPAIAGASPGAAVAVEETPQGPRAALQHDTGGWPVYYV